MESPIAIVGMSCRFAGSANPAALWRNVLGRRNCLTPLGEAAEIPLGGEMSLIARILSVSVSLKISILVFQERKTFRGRLMLARTKIFILRRSLPLMR